jgi:hypothetical protein
VRARFSARARDQLSNAGYALFCSAGDDAADNLFTDGLGIPLIMPWDHGLFQFTLLICRNLFHDAAEGWTALSRIREVLDYTLMHHLPIDTGQVTWLCGHRTPAH